MRSGAYFFTLYFLLFGLMAGSEIMNRTMTAAAPSVFIKTQKHAVTLKRSSLHLSALLDQTDKTSNKRMAHYDTLKK